jgi:hypothetical protein
MRNCGSETLAGNHSLFKDCFACSVQSFQYPSTSISALCLGNAASFRDISLGSISPHASSLPLTSSEKSESRANQLVIHTTTYSTFFFLSRASVANSGQIFPASTAKRKLASREKVQFPSNFNYFIGLWANRKTVEVYVLGKSIIFLRFS